MKILNVLFFAVAGFIGLTFLSRTLRRLEEAQTPPVAESVEPVEGQPGVYAVAQPIGRRAEGGGSRRLFRVWLVLYALVGAQMGWVLRPFIGNPNQPFTWFRAREANFFLDVLRTLRELLS